MQLTLKERIIIHINYRDIFNAPVKKSNLIKWIGEKVSIYRIDQVLNELKSEALIIEKDGFLAIHGKEEIITLQQKKSKLSQELILKGSSFLKLISKLPFIKFMGISGSIAADNPTPDKTNHIDLDLFVISSRNSLWLIFLFERIFSAVIKLVKGNYFYCFNYVTEETFLEIHNKNFYTASEMVNLIPIVDKGIFNDFIASNQWYKTYYSKESISIQRNIVKKSYFPFIFLIPINYMSFFLYCVLKAVKKLDIKYLFDFKVQFDAKNRGNLKRISVPNGGYQEKIRSRFKSLFSYNFSAYMSEEIIDKLFPPEEAFDFVEENNVDNLETIQQFKKYA